MSIRWKIPTDRESKNDKFLAILIKVKLTFFTMQCIAGFSLSDEATHSIARNISFTFQKQQFGGNTFFITAFYLCKISQIFGIAAVYRRNSK